MIASDASTTATASWRVIFDLPFPDPIHLRVDPDSIQHPMPLRLRLRYRASISD